eukprot:6782196-Prymnesium_polylepis.1
MGCGASAPQVVEGADARPLPATAEQRPGGAAQPEATQLTSDAEPPMSTQEDEEPEQLRIARLFSRASSKPSGLGDDFSGTRGGSAELKAGAERFDGRLKRQPSSGIGAELKRQLSPGRISGPPNVVRASSCARFSELERREAKKKELRPRARTSTKSDAEASRHRGIAIDDF